MINPKTTILGYLAIIGAVVSIAQKLLTGNAPSAEDIGGLVAGIGLIAARDGGH